MNCVCYLLGHRPSRGSEEEEEEEEPEENRIDIVLYLRETSHMGRRVVSPRLAIRIKRHKTIAAWSVRKERRTGTDEEIYARAAASQQLYRRCII